MNEVDSLWDAWMLDTKISLCCEDSFGLVQSLQLSTLDFQHYRQLVFSPILSQFPLYQLTTNGDEPDLGHSTNERNERIIKKPC